MPGVKPEEDQRSEVPGKRVAALRDAAPLLMTFAAGLICYGLFYNRGLGLSVIGYSIAPAERVMQGEVPYRDFLFNYTPGILWVNALLMKAFGATLMATRIGLFVFKLTTLLELYYLGRRLMNRWAALVPVALTLAWPGYQQIFNVYPDQYLILFALASLICMLRYNATGDARSLFLSGLCAGAVFIFKYNVGVLLLGTAGLALVLKELTTTRRIGGVFRTVTFYVSGFAIVAGGLTVYLIYNHAFGAMVNHFLHHAAEYSEARSVGLPCGLVAPQRRYYHHRLVRARRVPGSLPKGRLLPSDPCAPPDILVFLCSGRSLAAVSNRALQRPDVGASRRSFARRIRADRFSDRLGHKEQLGT